MVQMVSQQLSLRGTMKRPAFACCSAVSECPSDMLASLQCLDANLAEVNHASISQKHNSPRGSTALHECTARASGQLQGTPLNARYLETARLLLEAGANPFLENSKGESSVQHFFIISPPKAFADCLGVDILWLRYVSGDGSQLGSSLLRSADPETHAAWAPENCAVG